MKKLINQIIVKKELLFLSLLTFLGFYHRMCGLSNNYSFWTDENHVAIFARAILERGAPVLENGYHTGLLQSLWYWITALFMKIFGISEMSTRLPSVFFGVLAIPLAYLTGKATFSKGVGIVFSFFVTFLTIQILWSRQARPYQALQFFWLFSFYLIVLILKENPIKNKYKISLVVISVLAFLMHGLGLLLIGANLLIIPSIISKENLKKFLLFILPILLIGVLSPLLFRQNFKYILDRLGEVNNLYYYRVFFTHNYLVYVFFALIGFYFLWTSKRYRVFYSFCVYLFVQFFAVSFLIPQPFTRYLYPVLPLIFLLAAYGIEETYVFIGKLKTRGQKILPACFVLFLLFLFGTRGNLTFNPKKIYSLNHDMQEIPEVNWQDIYSSIEKLLKKYPDAILITNWNDLPIWYLGEKSEFAYLLRTAKGREFDELSGAAYIKSLNDLRKILNEKEQGIIVLDSWDNYIPDGAREYCELNLRKEFVIDRLYFVQPRYWPVTVYSWGLWGFIKE